MGNILTNGTITGTKFIGPVTNKYYTNIDESDYVWKAIACCKAPTNATGGDCSWSSGRLVPHRINGIYMTPTIDYTFHNGYGAVNKCLCNYSFNGRSFIKFTPTVFTYNGVKYGGFIYMISNATDFYLGVDTVGNFEPFHCGAVYRTSDGVVINSEIYNSIDTSEVSINNDLLLESGNLYCNSIIQNNFGSSLPGSGVNGQVFFKI